MSEVPPAPEPVPTPEPTPVPPAPAAPAYGAAQVPPAYSAPPVYGAAPVGPKTNTLAIVSLILSILWLSIGGIITGHIALSQIKKRAEGGHGLALAGVIVGYVGALGWIIFWIGIGLTIAFSAAACSASYYCSN